MEVSLGKNNQVNIKIESKNHQQGKNLTFYMMLIGSL